MQNNIITLTDSYKTSHWKVYPDNLKNMFSYFESRDGAKYKETVFFGLQYILKEYLEGQVVTETKIQKAKKLIDSHMGPGIFNEEGWRLILTRHNGRLPVRIKAVPEGTPVTVSNVLMSVEVTDEDCAWLTNYLETLLTHVWSPSTVATSSREQKKILKKYLEETGNPDLIDFKLHDFSFRGDSSVETAGVSGLGHLINFKGTDTMKALEIARDYYDAENVAFSIPATEHSQMSIFGREGEAEMMARVLKEFPSGLVACVSDTYDIYNACSNIWGDQLKENVLAREGCLVIRPDSGKAEVILPEMLRILGQAFGQTKNEKGYFVLNDKVRIIQGDNVDPQTLELYLTAIKVAGYSADNIAFGSGGGLVQKVNRDTQRFAFKCSAAKIGDKWIDVYKDPVTDSSKKSKRGRLALVKTDTGFETVREEDLNGRKNELVTVFEDGFLLGKQNFEEIRKRAII